MVAQRRRRGLGLGGGRPGGESACAHGSAAGPGAESWTERGFQGGVLVRAPAVGITRVSENKLTQMKITENLEDP